MCDPKYQVWLLWFRVFEVFKNAPKNDKNVRPCKQKGRRWFSGNKQEHEDSQQFSRSFPHEKYNLEILYPNTAEKYNLEIQIQLRNTVWKYSEGVVSKHGDSQQVAVFLMRRNHPSSVTDMMELSQVYWSDMTNQTLFSNVWNPRYGINPLKAKSQIVKKPHRLKFAQIFEVKSHF